VFKEEVLKELAKRAVSVIQPTQSRISFPFSPMSYMQYPMGSYNPDPAANLQVLGFRGYVCEKCLTPETHYVAFPADRDGSIQSRRQKQLRQVDWLIDSDCLDHCKRKFQR